MEYEFINQMFVIFNFINIDFLSSDLVQIGWFGDLIDKATDFIDRAKNKVFSPLIVLICIIIAVVIFLIILVCLFFLLKFYLLKQLYSVPMKVISKINKSLKKNKKK